MPYALADVRAELLKENERKEMDKTPKLDELRKPVKDIQGWCALIAIICFAIFYYTLEIPIPIIPVIFGCIGFLAFIINALAGVELMSDNIKTCPFCRKHIHPDAIVCQYCQQEQG